jgi:hypothetical protein
MEEQNVKISVGKAYISVPVAPSQLSFIGSELENVRTLRAIQEEWEDRVVGGWTDGRREEWEKNGRIERWQNGRMEVW